MSAHFNIGDKISSRWDVLKILEGGMGIVYVVFDHEFQEVLAVKTFRKEAFLRNPAVADRFNREALAWTNLDLHENIAEARFVRTIDGFPYLFIEYVSGGDLSSWIGTPRLTANPTEVIRLALEFCNGMIHVLSRGITAHRDIKPRNCLLTGTATLKVTDFGLVKVIHDTPEMLDCEATVLNQSVILSRTGTAAGTCTHMAPEQFDNAKGANVRSDVYAFGVMFYQMLTGRLPFEAASWRDFERLHKMEAAPLLACEKALNDIVQVCLAKAPSARFGGFEDIRARLEQEYERRTGHPPRKPAEGAKLTANHWGNKGVSLLELGQPREALRCIECALELQSSDHRTWNNKGVALNKLKRTGEAIQCFDRALELNPDSVESHVNKAYALTAAGRDEESLPSFDRITELQPNHPTALFDKGITLGKLKRIQEALGCFERVISSQPEFARAWREKGVCLLHLRQYEKAADSLTRALALTPDDAETLGPLGFALNHCGRCQEAISFLNKALDLNPRDSESWFQKGSSLVALGRNEEGIVPLHKSLELEPGNPLAWANLGVALMNLGRKEEELKAWDRAIELNPQDQQSLLNRGIVLNRLGRFEEALTASEQFIKNDPRSEGAWMNMAWAANKLGRNDVEINALNRLFELNPTNAQYCALKVAAHEKLSQLDEAIRVLDHLILLHPEDPSIRNKRDQILSKSGSKT
jgi:tetratricopeptide (TPR) repeat protein